MCAKSIDKADRNLGLLTNILAEMLAYLMSRAVSAVNKHKNKRKTERLEQGRGLFGWRDQGRPSKEVAGTSTARWAGPE